MKALSRTVAMAANSTSASPVLVRLEGSPPASVQLKRPLTIVGSKLHSHLRIVSTAISGSHALFLNLGNNVFLRDLMSRTHVYVNDQEVAECRLKYGDIVRFGEMRFRFVDANVLRQSLSSVRPPPAKLYRELGGEHLTLEKPMLVIGRHAEADLVLGGAQVSKAHAVIYEHDGQRMIRALGSRDGMFINESAIRSARLRSGDTIRIGTTLLHYVTAEEQQTALVEPAQVDVTDNTNDAESPPDSHTFVSDPVIISSPTELVDTDPVELTDAPAPHQPTNSLALPGDWDLEAETIAPVELPDSSFFSTATGVGAAGAESPAELAESANLETAEASQSRNDISADATSASHESAELSLSEPVQLEALTPTPSASPSAAMGDLDAFELDSLEQDSRLSATGQESTAHETPDATFEPSHLAEPLKPRGSDRKDLRAVLEGEAGAKVGQNRPVNARQSNPKGLDDILATEVLTLYPSSILEDNKAGASANPPSRSRRMWLIIASALAAFVVSGAGAWYYLHYR